MNNTFSTSTTINDEYMVFPYSSSLLPFSPSSSINDILIHHTSNTNNRQFLQALSPFSHQFEFVPDLALLGFQLPQNNSHDDSQIIPNHHPSLLFPLNNPIGDQPNTEPSETITHIEDSQRISASQNPKMKKGKKPSRTDRHSKIKTAKGTRDRRMRLSLDVAKELFGLQDMLGFDKASKTVEWLLTQAKPEIMKIAKTLPHQFNHGSFSSGDESQTPFAIGQEPALGSIDTSSNLCELASRTVNDRSSNINTTTETRGNKVDGRSMRGKRKRLQPRTPILKKLSKDARAKARERAKDRTKEKMRRSQAKAVVEEEAHGRDEVIQNNHKNDVSSNQSSFVVTPYEEEIEKLSKKDRFAVCNELLMNQDHQTMDGSYDIIKKLNSSFPVLNQHRTQGGGAGSIEQHQFMDSHHFFQKPRDLMHNYQNMC